MTTQINVRVEEKTKREASKMLADIGLDMSSAVNIFLKQIVVEKGLPFTPSKNAEKVGSRSGKSNEERKSVRRSQCFEGVIIPKCTALFARDNSSGHFES